MTTLLLQQSLSELMLLVDDLLLFNNFLRFLLKFSLLFSDLVIFELLGSLLMRFIFCTSFKLLDHTHHINLLTHFLIFKVLSLNLKCLHHEKL